MDPAALKGELLSEIKTVGGHHAVVSDIKENSEEIKEHLNHVVPIDKSTPSIDPDVHIQKWDKEGLLKEIQSPHALKHVEDVNDRSQPQIEPTASVKLNEHGKLLQEIAEPHHLKHVETEDKAAPKITKTASMRIHAEQEAAAA